MNSETREYALTLLSQKEHDPKLTYTVITRLTGYSKRQLIRLSEELKTKDMDSILTHGNTGRKPAITASDQEVSYLRVMKEPYPSITIAQFRDIFIEDVLDNPKKQKDVKRYGLKRRSLSWFRTLFINEGWESPARKPIRVDGNHVTHPIRKPRDHRGELIQIDGTPYDWFGDGRVYTLHLAVDDATTEVMAGWFMPTECTRGYCRMMRLLLDRQGIPEALYSDKDSVFRSVKNGNPSQFARMLGKMNIQMIFANSPEAKGRIERYNGTIQNRLPNDLIRFGIPHSYDKLNQWFNDFYIPYINRKFSFPPHDPRDAFIPIMDEHFDYSKIFRIEMERVVKNGSISVDWNFYSAFNKDGERIPLRDGKITVYIDVFTEEMYIEYYGKHLTCMKVGERRRNEAFEVENQKELNRLLDTVHGRKKRNL